jgi:hypothetical protein
VKRLLFLILFFIVPLSASFSQTVFVTKSGKKYHTEECRYSATAYPVSLSDAIKRGYAPCKVCKPESGSTINSNENNFYQEPPKDSQYAEKVQCSATTKSGNRCKRMTKNVNGLCWQHDED